MRCIASLLLGGVRSPGSPFSHFWHPKEKGSPLLLVRVGGWLLMSFSLTPLLRGGITVPHSSWESWSLVVGWCLITWGRRENPHVSLTSSDFPVRGRNKCTSVLLSSVGSLDSSLGFPDRKWEFITVSQRCKSHLSTLPFLTPPQQRVGECLIPLIEGAILTTLPSLFWCRWLWN